VASQVGGLAFLVQDGVNGFTVPSGDPRALADRLAVLISDADLRHQIGEQAAAIAQGYGWDKIAARLLAVYDELLSMDGIQAAPEVDHDRLV
jgi:D-inositol-3-phosphate glycosyltransferase